MELESNCLFSEEINKVKREEVVVGHYSDSFGVYVLKKIVIDEDTDGKKRVDEIKLDDNREIHKVTPYDDFFEKNQKDKIFTKEELLNDFFEKINDINYEIKLRNLAKSAFDIFGREEMSQFFLNNLEKHQEDWPEKITIIEKVDEINRNFESTKTVGISTAEIIRGAF